MSGEPGVAAVAWRAVLVHGAGGGGWEWNLWRGVFEAHGIATLAPDLWPSTEGLAATGFDEYARQVRVAIEAVPRPRVLVGASLGGLLATACGDAADALVLVNPLPPAPWSARVPDRDWPDVVPWDREARLTSTRRALPDADPATVLFAFRRWRDESGAVLRAARAGIAIARPDCPVLCIASRQDEEVPPALTAAFASEWNAELRVADSPSHVGPLLGRDAAGVAGQAVRWLLTRT